MSVDPVALLNYAATVVVISILVLGIYRATQLRKAFVNRIYRSRMTWYVILMLTIIVTSLASVLPIPSTGILNLIGFIPFLALLVIIYAFVDRTVLVAIENDFFHRNTLHWHGLRLPVGIVLMVSTTVAAITSSSPDPGWQLLGNLLFVIVLPGAISYETAALIIGARRTSDRALKRSILLLGLALSTLAFSIVASTPFSSGTLPYVIVNEGTTVVGMVLIYYSVMSLSPLSRVMKEIGSAVLPRVA